MKKIEIPKFLEHLPTDKRGYPIPYFVPIVNGVPEFKYADNNKHLEALKHKKCCICGKKLFNKSYWFISGPMGFENGVDSHSPMHEECARFSLKVCPHLFYEHSERKTDDNSGSINQIRQKPSLFFLSKADKFKAVKDFSSNATFVKFRKKYWETYEYFEGRLKRMDQEP